MDRLVNYVLKCTSMHLRAREQTRRNIEPSCGLILKKRERNREYLISDGNGFLFVCFLLACSIWLLAHCKVYIKIGKHRALLYWPCGGYVHTQEEGQ